MPRIQPPQIVTYDPSNTIHRKAYNEYVKTNAWGHTNLRFEVENPFYNVPSTLADKTLKFYLKGDKAL
jgi:hypothetical protein